MGAGVFLRVAVAVGVLTSSSARGQAPPEFDLEARFAEGRRAEEAFELATALRHYEATADAGAGTRAGRRAQARAGYLQARRGADGSFDDHLRFEHVRRGEVNESRLQSLAREVESMESPVVRADALFLLGEAYLRRLHRPTEAMPFYEAFIALSTVTPSRRRTAIVALAEARAAAGAPAAAVAELEQAGLGERFEATVIRSERARERSRTVVSMALVCSLVWLLVVGRPLASLVPAMRAIHRRHVFFTLYVLGVPLVIAGLYDPAVLLGFMLHAAFAVPLLFVSHASAHSLRRRGASRVVFATVLVAVATLAAAIAWLVLDVVDGLASFGFP